MASISFPLSPSNGDTYSYDGLTYQYNSTKNKWSVVATTTIDGVSADAIDQNLVPSANVTHDLGTSDKAFRDLYLSGSSINLGDATISSSGSAVTLPAGSTVGGVTIGTGSGGATQYANTASLPKTDLTFGEFAFVGNTLFITNGSGWYSVGVVNQSPQLTLSTSSISLGSSGNTINFTFTATDPDGPEPTVTMTTTANTSQANVTLYTSNSTVTVENLSATDYSATITLTATDGIDQTFGTVTLTVGYLSELWDETVLSIGTSSTNSLDNSTFIDRSTNAHTVTETGNPTQTSFHPYLDNWSVEFDGNDYINTGNATNSSDPSATLTVGVDKTIEFFIYMSNLPTDASGVIGASNGGGSQPKWSMFVNTNTSYTYQANRIMFASNSGGTSQNFEVVWESNRWYHIAWVWDQSTSTSSLYVDGTRIGTGSYEIDSNIVTPVDIGSDGEQYKYFSGRISNVRILNGTALYSGASITVPTQNLTAITDTTLLTCQSNRFADNSTLNNSFTISGDPKVSALNPFGQHSEYVVGENKGSFRLESGDWVQSPSTSQASLSYTQDWTIEFWAYMDNDMTSVAQVLFNSVEGTGNWYPYIGSVIKPGGILQTQAVGGEHNTTGTVNRNEWFHVALVHDYSANELKTYLNGTLVQTLSKTYTFTTGAIRFNTYTINTASNYPTLGGYLSDFKWTIGSTVYTSNFTPPTSPVGNTNAGLYFPMDNAGIFDKTGNETITLVGVTTSTTQTKFDDTSYYIASPSTNYIGLDTIPDYGRAPFTLEMWVYPTATNTNMVIFDTRPNSSLGFNWNLNGGTGMSVYAEGSTRLNVSNVITNSSWNHIALVFDGTNATAYANGTAVASAFSIGSSSPWSGAQKTLGAVQYTPRAAASGFVGYIEGFQLLIGITKYTANFTPPTKTQGIAYQAES